MIPSYSYDECCKEIMLKLIYLTKCIIDSLSESKNSKHGNPKACLMNEALQYMITTITTFIYVEKYVTNNN